MSCDAEYFSTSGTAPQLFASALNFLAATQCIVPNKTDPYDEIPDIDTFDFIIVGSGSAGSVVANRLSEIETWKVLLLEAGPEPPIESDIPSLGTTLFQSKYDWQYTTKSNGDKQQGWRNGALSWPRGKMLGGSSSMNSMVYMKGRDHDYQCWDNEQNSNWSKEKVDYYFKKAENFQDMKLNKNPVVYQTYGHSGPLVVNSLNSTYKEITENLKESWNHLGIKSVPDINAAKYRGYGLSGIARVTAQNGHRESTYRAYLKPMINRKNMKIITNAFVTKILIDDNTSPPQAYGVEVEIGGQTIKLYSNYEVILSTGTINTPQILMLSGIGPKEHLLSKNISCIVDLASVGKNLQDHLYVPIPIYGDKPGIEDTTEEMFSYAKYLYNKTGARDVNKIVDGIKMVTKLVNTPYFKTINAFIPKIDIPECNQYEFQSDLYWKCYSLQISGTIFHPVGTARMGFDPEDSVVDKFLKVHGIITSASEI
ncbi:ecdysone oxidase-like [Bicyclus anynana]|uniref:Ecdysone oxidase-like n=1 Tax=Bicyclus anynana TaxID=110368 RepID=A0ABM3LMS8_BICAN|nr:ecdysone oxidase-like [Bicyclus anynana]